MATTSFNVAGKHHREDKLDSKAEDDPIKLKGSAKPLTSVLRLYGRPPPSKIARMTGSTSAFSMPSHVRISMVPNPSMPTAAVPIPATTSTPKPTRSEFLEWYAPRKEERRLQEQMRSRSSPVFSPLRMYMTNICTKERHLDHGCITLSRVDEAMKAMIDQLPQEAFTWSGAFPGRTETRKTWASTDAKVVCYERRCLGHREEGDVIVTVTAGRPGGRQREALVVHVPFADWREAYTAGLWNARDPPPQRP
ncbi:hypothetical protein FRB94_000323 [Tulasnella sp. JGI-2019a]|nr:hypothetical protein FRB94_000323 [Tulasnella sp. JGI-2019a]KAG8999156.1 hypothetical protein FRB93_013313 [Tulasnella sp. JGI-2019a]KAG9022549.1 hypothetical protein FRB95_014624 [Tulasnella sp. JGI-2019a]